jgi:DNA-binding SARP family transcriptional activator/class 3 adenylate cyclase/TolB-like protein
MCFSLQLLGGVALQGSDGPVRGRAAHKRRLALLAVLAGARGRPVARERILGLLWPESPSTAGRHLLSESLSVMRREIGEDAFVCRGDELTLNSEIIVSDLDAFERAAEQGDAPTAARIYLGPFMEGFYVADAPDFERWAEEERDRLGRVYASVLETLALEREAKLDHRAAAEWWRRLALHDRYSSRVALRLMRALEAAGEREAALLHAGVHAALLREELGAEPTAELRDFTDLLRRRPPAPASQEKNELAVAEVDAARGVNTSPAESGDGDDGRVTAVAPAPVEVSTLEGGEPDTAAKREGAVWFADVAEYSELLARDADIARGLLAVLHELARREVRRAGGHVVGLIGEGVLAEFPDPAECARSAARLLRGFERRARQAAISSTLQVGAHAGLVSIADDGGVYGDPVSVASRLQERAEPGEVLVSGELRARLLAYPEFRFAPRGVLTQAGNASALAAFDLEVELPARQGGARPAPAAQVPWPNRRARALAPALLVTAVLALIALLWQPTGVPSVTSESLDPNRVAVLYFSPTSDDADLRALARGLTDQLIRELSEVDALDVIPPSGVRPYRGAEVSGDSIARVLRAGTVIEGSIERSDDRIRLTTFLVDAASGRRLRSKLLTARAGDPIALEDQLALEASRFLRWRLGRDLEIHAHTVGTRNGRARELVLRSEQLREDAQDLLRSSDSLKRAAGLRLLGHADTLLMRAQAADPLWAEVPELRGWVALERGGHLALPQEKELLLAAGAHAEQALRLRPDGPGGLELRGNVRWALSLFYQRADSADSLVEAARVDLTAAVDADPRRATAWNMLSQLLRVRGDHAGSYMAAERAVRADAYLLKADQVRHRLFRIALSAGRIDLARQHCEAGAREFPNDWRFVECPLVLLAYDDGHPAAPGAAAEALARVEAVDPAAAARADGRPYLPVYRRMLFASVLARAGMADTARAVAAQARAGLTNAPEIRASLAYDQAYLSLCLGDRPGAVRALRELFRLQPQTRRMVASEHQFQLLRGERDFQAAIRGE